MHEGPRRAPLLVYGDFNCPFSALASMRVAELESRGIPVTWRAVEHDPTIPEAGVDVTGHLADMFSDEVDRIRSLLQPGETNPVRVPDRQLNTRRSTERYAGTTIAERPSVRREVFHAHWESGARIDDDDVLTALGAGAADPAVAATWRHDWQTATRPIVPVLVLPDGYVSRGLGALARLADAAAPGGTASST